MLVCYDCQQFSPSLFRGEHLSQLVSAPETYLYQPTPPQAEALRVGWAYPAPYAVAMSSLGYLSLFAQLDQRPDVAVERLYEETMTRSNIHDKALLGYSFSFELDILSILKTLETAGLPWYARDRAEQHPLVFAGGPVPMTNPEPYADFFDFLVIGEGEEILAEIVAFCQRNRGLDRPTLLHRLAVEVPGVYVPSLYLVDYGSDGSLERITPCHDDLPFPIQKRFISDMDSQVTSSPILTEQSYFANTFLVEVMRGCAHRCRFCLASYSMLPARGPSLEAIISRIQTGLKHTHKIGLLGALIADHPQFDELCDFLNTQEGLRVSGSSLRGDTLTPAIARTFKQGGQKQLTIAVESGSAKLRKRINKHLSHDEILTAARNVAEAGIPSLKLYAMVGLPDETEEDVLQTAELVRDIRKENPKLKVVLGCSSFVPKAWTPFQWQPRPVTKLLETRMRLLEKAVLKVADFRPQSPKWDFIQGVLSRGDRRLAPLLVRFYQLGGSAGSLNRAWKALQSEGISLPPLDGFALRERSETEILPWDVLHLGVSKEILWKEGLAAPLPSS